MVDDDEEVHDHRQGRRRGLGPRRGGQGARPRFVVLVGALVGLSIASYLQVFTPVVTVTLLTDKVGTQMQDGADVKVRGLIVGQVRDIEVHDGGRLGQVTGASSRWRWTRRSWGRCRRTCRRGCCRRRCSGAVRRPGAAGGVVVGGKTRRGGVCGRWRRGT